MESHYISHAVLIAFQPDTIIRNRELECLSIPLARIKLTLNEGDVLLFHPFLFHAEAAYHTRNFCLCSQMSVRRHP